MDFPYDTKPRKPKVEVTYATDQLVKFTLTDTDPSVANSVRRIIMAEVPTMAVELVNVEHNDSVLFDEFIAHRMGLLPLTSHDIGDIPPDIEGANVNKGFREQKECNCYEGCPQCTVEYILDVENNEDKVKTVTHFDVKVTDRFQRGDLLRFQQIEPVPFRNEDAVDYDQETRDNGIIIAKLKKNQRLKMLMEARKGIPKYHAKFMPVATCTMTYQQIVKLDEKMLDGVQLDEKVDFVESCPTRVFGIEGEKVFIEKLNDCMYCDECVAKSKTMGKKGLVTVDHDTNTFHFTVEAVTPHGPRSMIDVTRAALRIFDYKLGLFLKDSFDDEDALKKYLPAKPRV